MAAFACSVACGETGGATADVDVLPGGDGPAWWEGDGAGSDAPGGGKATPGGPREEICDGLDNDLDGTSDEGTDGGPCTAESGVAGTLRCVAGALVCHACNPGDERVRTCGCGADTVDVCNDSGRWLIGACGCPDLTSDSCGVNPQCEPGEERVRRCDTCPAGQDCGSSCLGALFRCTNACTWQQVGACQTRPPVCDRDLVRVEPCGKCGRRTVTCDGCFFVESPCQDQGACNPGDEQPVACFGNACVAGYAASVRCNDQCSWEASACEGCAVGPPEDRDISCISGHPECGKRVVRSYCEAETTLTSCEGTTLTVGRAWTETVLDQCANVEAPGYCTPNEVTTEPISCGPNTCGRTRTLTRTCLANGCGDTESITGSCPTCSEGERRERSCTPAAGGCGTQSMICDDTCSWGAWSECTQLPNLCTPGAVEVEELPCGACGLSRTRTRTCLGNGCGWSETTTGSCGSCSPGQTDSEACTSGAVSCGTRSRSCTNTCEWGGWSGCSPAAGSCTPGEQQTRACTAACNKPGSAVWECSGGCGEWTQVTECESAQVQCEPGDTQIIGPCPLCPTVSQTRTCDAATCSWVTSSCPVCL